MLIAAETAEATTIVVGWGGGRLAFARTLLASWSDEPGRVGGEINRSLLYAKQQLGTIVNTIRLFGDGRSEGEVRTRCGDGREISTGAVGRRSRGCEAVAPLSPWSPGNLLGDHLRRQRRRQCLRAGLAAACWLGLALVAMSAWDNWSAAKAEEGRFEALQAHARCALRAERDRLEARNRQVAEDRNFIAEAAQASLPPIPARFLGIPSPASMPPEIRLTEFPGAGPGRAATGWSYRLGGTIAGNEDTARTAVAALQQWLEQGPWHAHGASRSRRRPPHRRQSRPRAPASGPSAWEEPCLKTDLASACRAGWSLLTDVPGCPRASWGARGRRAFPLLLPGLALVLRVRGLESRLFRSAAARRAAKPSLPVCAGARGHRPAPQRFRRGGPDPPRPGRRAGAGAAAAVNGGEGRPAGRG